MYLEKFVFWTGHGKKMNNILGRYDSGGRISNLSVESGLFFKIPGKIEYPGCWQLLCAIARRK